MYEIKPKSAKIKRKFENLLKNYSVEIKKRIKTRLENSPYPSQNYGNELCKVEKKGKYFCYPMSGSDRVLYIVIEKAQPKQVMIFCAGNDDEEKRFLKKNG